MTQFYQKDFERAGLKIDTSEYGRWVERSAHRRWHPEYNKEWEKFFEPKKRTQDEILDKLKELKGSNRFPSYSQ